MEFHGCGQECGGDFLVEREGQLDQLGDSLVQGGREVSQLQVLSQEGTIDGGEGICSWEGEDEHAEVTLHGEGKA